MEDDCAGRQHAGPRCGSVRMREGRARGKGDGAGAHPEAVRALRLRKLRDGSGGRTDLDDAARAIVETGEIAGAGICARLSSDGKRIVTDGPVGRGEDASRSGGAEGIDPTWA